MVKYDPAGNFLWARAWGGQYTYEHVAAIAHDAAGNAYILGNFPGEVDFDPGPDTFTMTAGGSTDIFLMKLDPAGNFMWAKPIGGPDWERAWDLAVDPMGHIVLIGVFSGTTDFDPGPAVYTLTSGYEDSFVLKLDANGNFLWAKKICQTSQSYDHQAIAVDTAGNIYATGTYWTDVDLDPGPDSLIATWMSRMDGYLLKLDPNGEFRYARPWGGAGNDIPMAISVDRAGNACITGTFDEDADFDINGGSYVLSAGAEPHCFVARYDSVGNFISAGSWGNHLPISVNDIATDEAGNMYTIGRFEGAVDFDPGPGVFTLTPVNAWDLFVSKLDPSGNFLWAFQVDRADGKALTAGTGGTFYLAGEFWNPADFDPGPGTHNIYTVDPHDVFVCKMNQPPLGRPDAAAASPFIVYPNPTNGPFSIDMGRVHPRIDLSIADALGRPVLSATHSGTQFIHLDLEAPAGVYFVTLQTKAGPATVRLVKD